MVSYGRGKRGASWTNGGVVTTLAGNNTGGFANGTGTNASFYFPNGVVYHPTNGNIFVADVETQRIRLVTPDGVVTTFAGSGSYSFADGTGGGASFRNPRGVAVDSNNNVVVADMANQRIRLITPAGVVTTLAGSGSYGFADGTGGGASFANPYGVAVLPDGNIAVADGGNNRIRIVTPAGVVTTLAGSGTAQFADGTGTNASFSTPYGIAYDPTTGNIVVADVNTSRVRLITYPGGVVTTLAIITYVKGVAVTPTGVIVVAWGNDGGGNKILLVTPAGVVTTLAGSGSQGSADGTGTNASFNDPRGVAVNPLSGVIAVAGYNEQRIRLIT